MKAQRIPNSEWRSWAHLRQHRSEAPRNTIIPETSKLRWHQTLRNTTGFHIYSTDAPYGNANTVQLSQQQSQRKKLVPFASLSAISRTFNPLSKVLFTFPSRYLFAIGLGSIFSFRRKLPPILRSISKERDSIKPYRTRSFPKYTGFSPSLMLFSKKTYSGSNTGKDPQDYNSVTSHWFTCWALPGSIAFTKGIIFIFFSSAYLYA